jgi:hypothetical protein
MDKGGKKRDKEACEKHSEDYPSNRYLFSSRRSFLLPILAEVLDRGSFPAVASSDPIFYINCFDETEIHTMKLWMGSFVKDYNELTKNVIFNF